MQIRTPVVAGMFYSDKKNELKEFYLHKCGPDKNSKRKIENKIFGVICPHA